MTLADLGAAVGRSPSRLSEIENGLRAPRLELLESIAAALGTTAAELLETKPLGRRDAAEVELARIQSGPMLASLGIAPLKAAAVPTPALDAISALAREIERLQAARAASAEEARAANTRLRSEMRRRANHFPELEAEASRLRAAIDRQDGPLGHDDALAIAGRLGFDVELASDLPATVRSVTDLARRRVFLPDDYEHGPFSRSVLLGALAAHILGHGAPGDYPAFLRQRVESNYLSAAVLVPKDGALARLRAAAAARELSLDDLATAYAVGPEIAAHRFTNLASLLGLTAHFAKIHRDGAISKAYENDGMPFPTDVFGNIEGQSACRHVAGRQALDAAAPLAQYTDTPAGTFFEVARLQPTPDGLFSLTLGVPFESSRLFAGRATRRRRMSRCPDETCCRRAISSDATRLGQVRAVPRAHSSVLAALPAGPFPGISEADLEDFLTGR